MKVYKWFLRYEYLSGHPKVFRSMTGLRIPEFNQLMTEVAPLYAATERKRLARLDRVHVPGPGHPFRLDYRDLLLLTLIWLGQYSIGEVLGYFFGVSEPGAWRTAVRMLPVLEAASRSTFRWPDRKQGRSLPEILDDCPEAAVVIDTFEQRVWHPNDREKAKGRYSGKPTCSRFPYGHCRGACWRGQPPPRVEGCCLDRARGKGSPPMPLL